MQVCNVVKFKVKSGQENAFLDAHRAGKAKWPGLERGVIIKTGEQTFCLIGTWASEEAMVAARAGDDQDARQFSRHARGSGRGARPDRRRFRRGCARPLRPLARRGLSFPAAAANAAPCRRRCIASGGTESRTRDKIVGEFNMADDVRVDLPARA